jgi:hypothetical protein
MPQPKDLTEWPDDDQELDRDSYLSPAFSRHDLSLVEPAPEAILPNFSSNVGNDPSPRKVIARLLDLATYTLVITASSMAILLYGAVPNAVFRFSR